MTEEFKVIIPGLIGEFVAMQGMMNDKQISDYLVRTNRSIKLSALINGMLTYGLIKRQENNDSHKYLTPEGYGLAQKGIDRFILNWKLNQFINSFWGKAATILISTFISLFAIFVTIDSKDRDYYSKQQVGSMIQELRNDIKLAHPKQIVQPIPKNNPK